MFQVYLLKIKLKIIHLAKKYKPPMKILSLDEFYATKFFGSKPNSYYFLNRKNPKFFFNPAYYEQYVKHLKNEFPESVTCTLARADDFLNHKFNFLGSGEKSLGKEINWHQDFKSGISWSKDYHTKIKIVNQNDNSDIKVPWELSRLQHFTDLGKAFWITEYEVYLREFVTTIKHWEEENKVGYGPNWTCSMEVSIRAINIIWGLYFFSAKNLLTDKFIQQTIRLLYYHALHIEQNLETIEDGANTNHLLSNYLGLFYIGLLFPEFDRSQSWRQIACKGLEKEIALEINSDGADYECSTSYHRLVFEIFLSAYILGKKNNFKFSENYKTTLQKMLHFSESITPPSGKTPLVGDNDDGFIIKLSHDNPASHSHLIELGAEILNLPLPNFIEKSEESLFYFGLINSKSSMKKEVHSSLFKESGYAVIRNKKLHLLFSASKIAPKALGGHKHNDNLSFTLEYNKTPFFIDPGTFCYTSDFSMRNRNRSIAYHNTVSIDSEEQNRFFDSRLFYLFNDSKSEIDLWANVENMVTVSGIHKGYIRLNDTITHQRTIWVFLDKNRVEILDEFDGITNNIHTFKTHFITPVVDVRILKDSKILIKENDNNSLLLRFQSNVNSKLNIKSEEYYPSFGVSKSVKKIICTHKSTVPFKNLTVMTTEQFNENLRQKEFIQNGIISDISDTRENLVSV